MFGGLRKNLQSSLDPVHSLCVVLQFAMHAQQRLIHLLKVMLQMGYRRFQTNKAIMSVHVIHRNRFYQGWGCSGRRHPIEWAFDCRGERIGERQGLALKQSVWPALIIGASPQASRSPVDRCPALERRRCVNRVTGI